MSEKPLTRLRAKSSASTVKSKNDAAIEKAWDDFASDLETHAKTLDEHSKKASKLAETVRTIKITKKVAGRTVPNSTHYQQIVTKTSDVPFKKS